MPEPDVNLTSALPDDIRESVAVENTKVTAGGPAFHANLAQANAIANQQAVQTQSVAHLNAMNGIREAAFGKIVESIIAVSPAEGGADVATLQQLLKGAQTTLPQTGAGG